MSTSNWLVPVAVMAIAPIVMSAVGRKSAAQLDTLDGWVELRLPRFFIALGWITALLAAGFTYGFVGLLFNGQHGTATFIGILAVAIGYGAYILIRDGRNHRLAYSDELVRVTNGDRSTADCAWSEIVAGKVHPISKMIHLKAKDGQVLKINAYLISSDFFFTKLAERTDVPVFELLKRARYPG